MIWGGNPNKIEFPQMWKAVHEIYNDSDKGKNKTSRKIEL